MFSFRLKLRLVWIAALLLAIFVLAWLAIVPSGQVSYVKDFKHYNDFIGDLTPKERVEPARGGQQKIVGDPVYFSLRVPRRFEEAKVSIKFKPAESAPIVETGILTDKVVWQYDLRPLYNRFIEDLSSRWPAVREGSLILLQREKRYSGIDDFLADPPAQDKIALYDYDWNKEFILPDYQPSASTTLIACPLSGAYQFYTYLKGENLDFDFAFSDLNKNKDADPIEVYLYYDDKQIAAESLPDDGIAVANGAQKGERHLRLFQANLPEGVYKISLRANDDIVTKEIIAAQSKISFINKINLARTDDSDGCIKRLYTDSRRLEAQTANPDRLQKISIFSAVEAELASTSSGELDISAAYQKTAIAQTLSGLSAIVLEKDGVAVFGDGVFAFSREALIDPKPRRLDSSFNADKEGVDYVLARYVPPAREGDWLVGTADFDLRNVYKEKGRHSFLISVPGLGAEAGGGAAIKEIKVELGGTNIFEKIRKIMKQK